MKRFLASVTLAFAALSFGSANAGTYTVKPGDTLYSVARATGMEASTLMQLNRLPSTTIQVGQHLSTGASVNAARAAAPVRAAVNTPSRGSAFVRSAATRFLGVRYVHGGTGGGGIDCSGYTMSVFRQLGINLPRTASGQWSAGVAVNRSNLREGDLVFFNTTGRSASHVGIYLGGGMMANANSYHGRSMVEPLFSNPYWASRYQGARRVLN